MEKPVNPPTIRLQADEREISLQRIASALYDSLRTENVRIFSQIRVRGDTSHSPNQYHRGDFRSGIMAGPLNTSLLDDGEQVKIKQTRKVELEKSLLFYAKFHLRSTGEEIAQADRELSDMQLRVDSILTEPLSNIPMGEIIRIRVQGRIRKMLDDDVASEQLMVSSIGGKDVVLLDHLVTWAIFRKITVVQEALPGCTSFVHASYQRVHQHLTNVTQNLKSARSGGVEPNAGPLAASQDTTPSAEPVVAVGVSGGVIPDAGQLAASQPQDMALSPATVVKAKGKRGSWWDVASPYIIQIMQDGQYATAKELFNALEAKAGSDSPFDKGTGNHRYSLFIRELAMPLAVKTIQNDWQKLLKAAAQK